MTNLKILVACISSIFNCGFYGYSNSNMVQKTRCWRVNDALGSGKPGKLSFLMT